MKKHFVVAATFIVINLAMTLVAQAADPAFSNVAFQNQWVEQDRLVGTPGVTRPYTWGPSVPGSPATLFEPYVNSPGGQRRVQYFDKARMEINIPARGFVTTGLAVKELVSGQRQDGDDTFVQLTPSRTQVSGDPVAANPDTPVYASFQNVVTLGNADGNSKPSAIGANITASIDKSGTVGTTTPPEMVTIGAYDAQTGHNIAAPFNDVKNIRGTTTNPATGAAQPDRPIYTDNPTANVFGFAISEPYWVKSKVAGVQRTVLVQLFERRVLTYNPALPGSPLQKVEMGNLGQHYYQWRYVETGGGAAPPPANTKTVKVDINNFAFSPATLEISVGTKVIWTNLEEHGHTVTSNDNTTLKSKVFNKGETFEYTFTTPGTYDYYCTPHPFMKGKIIVK